MPGVLTPPERETPYGYCECGCGQKTNLHRDNEAPRGRVKGEPARFVQGHPRRRRLGEEYTVDATTGCWPATLTQNSGYGVCQRNGKHVGMHRWMYEQKYGPIPEGLQIDHRCRNRACVNPDHLEPVTQAENCRRGLNTKLTKEQVRYIKRCSLPLRPLAERFGVTDQCISMIRRGVNWKDVE